MRFKYSVLDNRLVLLSIDVGTDIALQPIEFTVNEKELLEFGKVLQNAAFDWVAKFNCRLDSPECY